MPNTPPPTHARRALSLLLGLLLTTAAQASSGVKILCRPLPDSILLRWAPTDKEAWDLGNRYGYVVERYTLLRHGRLLDAPERVRLTAAPQKPAPLSAWAPYEDNRFAAIAAQCLFNEAEPLPALSPVAVGKRYQLDQNRFALALYAADQSPLAAQLLGLCLTDRTAQHSEKYLYRVYVAQPDTLPPLDTGFAFTGMSEYQPLPKPVGLAAQWDNHRVALSWNILYLRHIYNSYAVEKSPDGKRYAPVSENATVQAAAADMRPEFAYRTDSLPDNEARWYYRIRGINAFGELGPPSDSVFGTGRIPISFAPTVEGKEVIGNQHVKLTWSYPEEMNRYVSGFRVYRSASPEGAKQRVYSGAEPEARSFVDSAPELTNYYLISVYDGTTEKVSPAGPYAELVDSTPPAPPRGFAGSIDSAGRVQLSWQPNADKDLQGYRVYRSNRPEFEFQLVTPAAISDTFLVDSVSLHTLTREVYYRLRAVDRRQNLSDFGEVLGLSRPDIIPPVAPVITGVTEQQGALVVAWLNSSSSDVALHQLYRREKSDTAFRLVARVEKRNERQSTYADAEAEAGKTYVYQLRAEDHSGLLSPPSAPVQQKLSAAAESVRLQKHAQDGVVALSWEVASRKKVARVLIYKATGSAALRLLGSTVEASFTDPEAAAEQAPARYRVRAVFDDGSTSELSNEVN